MTLFEKNSDFVTLINSFTVDQPKQKDPDSRPKTIRVLRGNSLRLFRRAYFGLSIKNRRPALLAI